MGSQLKQYSINQQKDTSYIIEIRYNELGKIKGGDFYFNANKFTEIEKDKLWNDSRKELFNILCYKLRLAQDPFKEVLDARNIEMIENAIIKMFIASDFMVTTRYEKEYDEKSFAPSKMRYFYFYKQDK